MLPIFLEANLVPVVICRGSKVLYVKLKQHNIEIKDSYLFFSVGLGKLLASAGITEEKKGLELFFRYSLVLVSIHICTTMARMKIWPFCINCRISHFLTIWE
jgi:hypothetical protein